MNHSISSFATIATNATSLAWQKMLAMNPERAAQEWRTFLAGGFLELAQAIGSPEPAAPGAGLSEGVKLRLCSDCRARPVRRAGAGKCNPCHAAYEKAAKPGRELRRARKLLASGLRRD